MENIEVVNAQPNNDIIVDRIQSHMHAKLWNLCAGPLCDLPQAGEYVYYFPQGHIELIEASTRQESEKMKPLFDLPSKLRCRVISIQRKVEKDTDEIYAEISLIPDTTQNIISIPNGDQHIPVVHYFTKVLTASDTSTHGAFSIPRKHATECLPPLDMSQPTPAQEIVVKDLHGQEWRFKHIYRGTPQRHLLTSGWNTFATTKKLVAGDYFVFLKGDNGELRVGIRRASHQQDNIPSSVISTQCMKYGVIASTVNAVNNQCMFIVVYKPRLSQFVVNYDKFVDAMNNNFNVGSRFRMRFEGEDFSERRYCGTVIGVNDLSPHWKCSEWRMLQVQWDELTSLSRPNKVSPWEIEHLTPLSNILQPFFPNKKRSRKINEIGSTSSNLWTSQEIGQSSMTSPITVPQQSYRDAVEDPKFPYGCLMSYLSPAITKPKYNNDQMVQPIKEQIATDASTSCIVFGVDLTKPLETKDPMEPIALYKKSEISKLSQNKLLDHTQTLTSSKEIQNKQFNSTRSRTKVHLEGSAIGRSVDLTVLHGYTQLRQELEKIFDIKSELEDCNQWEIIFMDNEGDMMLLGDDPWLEFCNMVKKIFVCSKEEVKKMKSGKKIFQA